ncbi:hypothetical protein C8R47DRAFT_1078296 [Mycena vitilis]|nr:hypothetical protein C8R47DRAFT_1078296 [Mycena vitilis]
MPEVQRSTRFGNDTPRKKKRSEPEWESESHRLQNQEDQKKTDETCTARPPPARPPSTIDPIRVYCRRHNFPGLSPLTSGKMSRRSTPSSEALNTPASRNSSHLMDRHPQVQQHKPKNWRPARAPSRLLPEAPAPHHRRKKEDWKQKYKRETNLSTPFAVMKRNIGRGSTAGAVWDCAAGRQRRREFPMGGTFAERKHDCAIKGAKRLEPRKQALRRRLWIQTPSTKDQVLWHGSQS